MRSVAYAVSILTPLQLPDVAFSQEAGGPTALNPSHVEDFMENWITSTDGVQLEKFLERRLLDLVNHGQYIADHHNFFYYGPFTSFVSDGFDGDLENLKIAYFANPSYQEIFKVDYNLHALENFNQWSMYYHLTIESGSIRISDICFNPFSNCVSGAINEFILHPYEEFY